MYDSFDLSGSLHRYVLLEVIGQTYALLGVIGQRCALLGGMGQRCALFGCIFY